MTLDAGSGGAVIRTDDDGSAHWQYVKIAWGADDTQTILTTGAPLPVDLRTDNLSGNLDVNIAASGATVTVSGTITANAGSGVFTVTDNGSFSLAASDGVDIGDVDVTSVIAGTGATNLGKAIDSVGGATDTGVAALAIRDDALTTLTPIDGDYVALRVGSTGALHVVHAGTLTVTDDGSFTLAANSGVDIGDVDILSIVPGTGATNLGKAEDAAHTTGDTGVMGLAVRRDADTTLVGTDGDYAPLQVDANGYLKVEIFDGGGSHTIDGTVTASNTAGDVAHDSADSGNPVKVGGVGRIAHPTAVAGGDRADLYMDDLGRVVTVLGVPRDLIAHNQITLTSTTETTLLAAGGAGVIHDLVYLKLSNSSGTAVRVDIRDDTAGTVRDSSFLAATGGGSNQSMLVPLTSSGANQNWTAQLSGAVSSVHITVIGIKQN